MDYLTRVIRDEAEARVDALLKTTQAKHPAWDIDAQVFDAGRLVGVRVRGDGLKGIAVRRLMEDFDEAAMEEAVAACVNGGQ